VACNFRPNETLKNNPENPPPFNFFFFCTWLPPLASLKKRHLANFSSYLTTPLKKRVLDPNISWRPSDHGSSNVCQKMCTVHPLAARTPACAYSNLTWFESRWQFAAAVRQQGVVYPKLTKARLWRKVLVLSACPTIWKKFLQIRNAIKCQF
jgi:hypothetical protein